MVFAALSARYWYTEQELEMDNQPPRRSQREQRDRGSRLLTGLILLALLACGLVIAYLVWDTVQGIRRPFTQLPAEIGEEIDQLINPTPTIIADPATVIRQVRTLARLETSSYTVQKVITAESGDGPLGFLFRDRLLLVATGQVIAGVDLHRMQESDVQVVDTTVYITMPAAEIFVATLDNDETYVYDRETGVLARQQVDLETLARQEAEREILAAALEDGILTMAQENANNYIESLMLGLGFEEVVFIQATPAPDQNLGE